MSKKSFKSTPIPYRTKSGDAMRYYVLSEDGKHETKVTRTECLARMEVTDGEFPQRWFVDEEAGIVVRLPRNQAGEGLARENMRFIWREAKYQERRYACLLRGTEKCGGWKTAEDGSRECDSCQRRFKSRTIEMDALFQREDSGNGDKTESRYELADPDDFQSVLEEKALLDTLYAALATLAQEDIDLIKDIFWHGKTERELAPLLGLKASKSVNKRKHRILELLRNNEALKEFFG